MVGEELEPGAPSRRALVFPMGDCFGVTVGGLALPLLNRGMTDPEQSPETSEHQWVGTPLTGNAQRVDLERSMHGETAQ